MQDDMITPEEIHKLLGEPYEGEKITLPPEQEAMLDEWLRDHGIDDEIINQCHGVEHEGKVK